MLRMPEGSGHELPLLWEGLLLGMLPDRVPWLLEVDGPVGGDGGSPETGP